MSRERAARKTRTGSPANDRRLVAIRELYDSDDLLGGARKHDAVWARDFDRAVVLVKEQVFLFVQNGVSTEKLFQIGEESSFHNVRERLNSHQKATIVAARRDVNETGAEGCARRILTENAATPFLSMELASVTATVSAHLNCLKLRDCPSHEASMP